ncbi:MAG: hypothetical protein KDA42_08525 [Planctomycetales bacterium]|nr:hypothetical protein [Planctomycetales bacterium]
MKTQSLQFGFIAIGFLFSAFMLARTFWPKRPEVLPPPDALAAQVAGEAPVEVKVIAARQLAQHGEMAREQIHAQLANHRVQEPKVVAALLTATARARDHRSLPTAVELLEHPDPKVRGQAGVAVRAILGADFGFRANAPPQRRAEVIAHIKRDISNAGSGIQEFYEGSQRP